MWNLQIGAVSDTGKQRAVNQDAWCAHDLTDRAEAERVLDGIFAVADGMGGHAHGERASQYAIQELRTLFAEGKYVVWAEQQGIDPGDLALVLKEAISLISSQIYDAAAGAEIEQKMGTTLTAALLAGKKMLIGHVGDSRAYLLRGGEVSQVTKDHSWINELLEQGVLTEEQARTHQARNVVTRSVGTDQFVQVDLYTLDFAEDDTLLLCSDGLSNSVLPEDFARILKAHPPRKACEKLVTLANRRDGSDNITCVIVTSGRHRSEKQHWILRGVLGLLGMGGLAALLWVAYRLGWLDLLRHGWPGGIR